MFGWTVDDLCGKSRRRPLVTARQIGMYVFRELTDYSYPKIAEEFGGRDHTTVMHACEKIRGQMAEKRVVFEQVNDLISRIKHGAEWITPVDSCGTIVARRRGARLPARAMRRHRPVHIGGQRGGHAIRRIHRATTRGCPQSTGPTTTKTKNSDSKAVEEDSVKFRCERDTLADAVATAQRTVASRSGALPVLQDLRITATDDGLELIGSDLEITNRVQVPAEVEEPGVAVVPKLLGEIVRKLEPGPVTVARHRRRSGDHRGPVLDVVAPEAGRGLPAARARATARACGSTPPRSRPRCARSCGPRRRTTCARSSPVC